MNKKKIALASLSSLLLSLGLGVQGARGQANVDSVIPDGSAAGSDSASLSFDTTTGETVTVTIDGASSAAVATTAAAVSANIPAASGGNIPAGSALATVLSAAAGAPLTSTTPLRGARLVITDSQGVSVESSPVNAVAIVASIASGFSLGGVNPTTSITLTTESTSVTVSISTPSASVTEGFPSLALDQNANNNLVATNLIAQGGGNAQGVIETTKLATQQTTQLIVSGNEGQLRGGLAAGVAAASAEIEPSGQQVAAELGTIAPSVDPVLMVDLTRNLQGLLSSISASAPSGVLVASVGLPTSISDVNQSLIAQAGAGVDATKLNDTINTYNEIVKTASDEDVEVLAANGSFAGLGNILKQLSSAATSAE